MKEIMQVFDNEVWLAFLNGPLEMGSMGGQL